MRELRDKQLRARTRDVELEDFWQIRRVWTVWQKLRGTVDWRVEQNNVGKARNKYIAPCVCTSLAVPASLTYRHTGDKTEANGTFSLSLSFFLSHLAL